MFLQRFLLSLVCPPQNIKCIFEWQISKEKMFMSLRIILSCVEVNLSHCRSKYHGGALIRISNCLEVVSILSHSPVKYHNLDSTNILTPI